MGAIDGQGACKNKNISSYKAFSTYIFQCDKCKKKFSDDELVFMTKENADKREAVIEAVKEFCEFTDTKAFLHVEGLCDTFNYMLGEKAVCTCGMDNLLKALEAYEGDK